VAVHAVFLHFLNNASETLSVSHTLEKILPCSCVAESKTLERRYVGVSISLRLFLFHLLHTNNTLIASKLIVLYMPGLNFGIVVWLFNVCCRFKLKMTKNKEISLAKQCPAVMKYIFLKGNSAKSV
jgi:hypothetical protein